MTIEELIDFYLSIQQPGSLVGFTDLYGEEIEKLKSMIHSHYGNQEAWLSLPETDTLPPEIEAQASPDKDELLIHEMDMDMVRQVRDTWQFFRDRRPETYGLLTDLN